MCNWCISTQKGINLYAVVPNRRYTSLFFNVYLLIKIKNVTPTKVLILLPSKTVQSIDIFQGIILACTATTLVYVHKQITENICPASQFIGLTDQWSVQIRAPAAAPVDSQKALLPGTIWS